MKSTNLLYDNFVIANYELLLKCKYSKRTPLGNMNINNKGNYKFTKS